MKIEITHARPVEGVTTWQYYVRDNLSGWGRFFITSDGLFFAITDYGNYGYAWGSNHSFPDLRHFLARPDCAPGPGFDPDYVMRKLGGEPNWLDKKRTVAAIREHLQGELDDDAITEENHRGEVDLLGQLETGELSFDAWYSRSSLWTDDGFGVYDHTPRLRMMVERLMPGLVDAIRAELAAEATPATK